MRPEETPSDVLVGQTLGRHYRVEARLGAGAMGVVYRVRHTILNTTFAAKVIAPDIAGSADARTRFLREADVLMRLHDPHVVSIRHFGEEDGRLYLVMDLCEGKTLKDLLSREGPLPISRAVPMALQILRALDAAHWEGVVHRDLKPANLVVTPMDAGRGAAERIRVLDFGLAHVRPLPTIPALRASATVGLIGTVAYMSPEQVRGDAEIDARSDLFSVGAVLYEMLTGRGPFDSPSVLTTALAILERPPPPLPEAGERGIPAELRRVLERLLEKDPSRRFESASAAAEALRGALTAADPSPRLAAGKRLRRRLLVPSVVLACGAILATLVGADRQRDREEASDREGRARVARAHLLDGRFEDALSALGPDVRRGEGPPEEVLLAAQAWVGLDDGAALGPLRCVETLLPGDPRPAIERARLAALGEEPDPEVALSLLDRIPPGMAGADAKDLRVWVLHLALERLTARGASSADVDALLDRLDAEARDLAGDPRHHVVEAIRSWHHGDLEGARVHAERAAEQDPDLALASRLGARISLARGERLRHPESAEEARRWFEHGLALVTEAMARARRRPEYRGQGREIVESWRLACLLEYRRGETDTAAAHFLNEVLGRNPHARRDLRDAARFLQWADRFRDALALYAAAEAHGEVTWHLHGIGYCRMQLGRLAADAGDLPGALAEFDAAVEAFGAGAVSYPDDPVYLAYRAEAWLARARIEPADASVASLESARADFRTLERRGNADHPEVLFRRWEYHIALGDHEAALADIRRSISLGVGDTAAHHRRLAYTLVALARGDAANERLEAALASADDAARWSPRQAALCALLRAEALASRAALASDANVRSRDLAAARAECTRAEALAPLDARVRAEAHLRAAATWLVERHAPAAIEAAEAALRWRRHPSGPRGSMIDVHESYLRSPRARFHETLAKAYTLAGRTANASDEEALAGALR